MACGSTTGEKWEEYKEVIWVWYRRLVGKKEAILLFFSFQNYFSQIIFYCLSSWFESCNSKIYLGWWKVWMNADHVINDILIDDTSNEILLTFNYCCYVLFKLLKGFQHNLLIHTQPITSCCCVWGIVSTTRPANNRWYEIMSALIIAHNHSMCFFVL